jgi:hypothetical protein
MQKFEDAKKVGLRDRETKKIIAVYPHKPEGTDEEIEKAVKDWHYQKYCAAEEELRNAYVDVLTEDELKTVRGASDFEI